MSEQPPIFGYTGSCRTCRAVLAWRRDRRSELSDVARHVTRMIAADLIVEYVRADCVYVSTKRCGCARATAMQLAWEE